MKKNLFAFIAVLGLVGLLSACSSDDKNDPVPPTPGATQFDGFYAGELEITIEGEYPLPKLPDHIEIIKLSNDRATLQLKNFTFGNANLGDIIVPDVVVTHKDGTYTLSGQADIKLVVGECKVDLEATVLDDKLDAKIDVVATPPLNDDGTQSADMEIKVIFKGVRTDIVASSKAEIISFGLKDIEATSTIVDKVVTLTVSEADTDKIKSAFPEVKISDKATISPALDVEQDFSEPIEYTVTAEDGKTKTTYTVKTLVAASSKAEILTFGLKDIKILSSVVEGETVTLTVDDVDADKIKEAIPNATISAGSTISPSLDVAQDFTLPVEYTITAEDNTTKATYIVTVVLYKQPTVIAFNFSASTEKHKNSKSKNKSALPIAQNNFIWDSSDGGVVQLFMGIINRGEKFGVTHDDGSSSFSIETLNTKGKSPTLGIFPAVPVITSGSLFLGSFTLNTSNPLESTAFGVVVDSKPLKVAGTANYKSGEEYYYCPKPTAKESHKVERIEGQKDEGLISAIVYEVTDKVKTLNGTNIYDSPNIIAQTKLTFEDGYTGDFSFDIDYTKDFDPTKTYKLAVILSSSKDGDKFSGAGGSVLTVSKLELTFE